MYPCHVKTRYFPIWTFYVQKYVLYPTSTVGGNFSNFVNAVMTQMMVTFACNYSL